MARAVTAKFEELIVEVEFTASSGTYTAICGITDASVTRETTLDETEIPDCADEGLPMAIERSARSQSVSISGNGVWALSSHEAMMDWWYGADTKLVRIRNAKAEDDGSTGDTYIEGGPAFLQTLNNARTKGQKVSAEIAIVFDGLPSRTAVA